MSRESHNSLTIHTGELIAVFPIKPHDAPCDCRAGSGQFLEIVEVISARNSGPFLSQSDSDIRVGHWGEKADVFKQTTWI